MRKPTKKSATASSSRWNRRGRSGARKSARKMIRQRAERAEKKSQDSPDWLDVERPARSAPQARQAGQVAGPLSALSAVAAKEIRPDVEAKPLYAMIGRKTSGDFALAVLRAFLGSKMDAQDRFALAAACLLGDDRVVPPLARQIEAWADSTRGKMAEYAVQALALLGTDAALSLVSSLAIRYRSKYKNIGAAAVEAFSAAAELKGMTPDELGDRVVPWLGFEPGKARIIEVAGRRLEVRIGMDLKAALHDLDKNKQAASLPKGASKEAADEFKELKESLREVVKGQLIRIENLFVRQHRWPIDRWKELFLVPPVLLPFAVRLVWALYDPQGRLQTTFHALEDRTLSDVEDEPYAIPGEGAVGIVHPLELTDQQRLAWMNRMSDYEIMPPVPQLERPVVVLDPQRRDEKLLKDHRGTRSQRDDVQGPGGTPRLAAGLGVRRRQHRQLCEVLPRRRRQRDPRSGRHVHRRRRRGQRHGARISVLSAAAAWPWEATFTTSRRIEKDPRLIPFGQVPPIVFSEAIADVKKIAGAKEETPVVLY